jgi:hypothetical protein
MATFCVVRIVMDWIRRRLDSWKWNRSSNRKSAYDRKASGVYPMRDMRNVAAEKRGPSGSTRTRHARVPLSFEGNRRERGVGERRQRKSEASDQIVAQFVGEEPS